MGKIQKLARRLKNMNPYSKFAMKLGFALMIFFYIAAIIIHFYAFHSADYLYAMSVYRGCLEVAPACLAVGICTGLLGDLMLSSGNTGNKQDDDPE